MRLGLRSPTSQKKKTNDVSKTTLWSGIVTSLWVVLLRYKQASAQVKGLQKEAGKLSSAAKEESKTAADALKDIANLEREIPSSLKVALRHIVTGLNRPPSPSFTPCCSPFMPRRGRRT